MDEQPHESDCLCVSCWAKGENGWTGHQLMTPEQLDRLYGDNWLAALKFGKN